MIVAGICAIQIDLITNFIGTILILAAVGAVATFLYVRFVCNKVFPEYSYSQFFAFFGMLTGTASTGMMLLRAADPDLRTPASENLVYQNFPAIIMGFPMLLLATNITKNAADAKTALVILAICAAYFLLLQLVIFRSYIFKKKKMSKRYDPRKGYTWNNIAIGFIRIIAGWAICLFTGYKRQNS